MNKDSLDQRQWEFTETRKGNRLSLHIDVDFSDPVFMALWEFMPKNLKIILEERTCNCETKKDL